MADSSPSLSDPPASLPEIFRDIANDAFHGDAHPVAFLHRTRRSLHRKTPQLKDALRQTSAEIVLWMRRGGPWRAFLVTAVGVVLLLALAGLSAFMLFFVTATVNAVAIGFLASLASVGAIAALFFTSLTAIYIGALITAVITISTITFLTICAALIAAGWIAFFWVIWQVLIKGADIFQGSVLLGVSALTGRTSFGSRHHEKIQY